MVLNVKILLDPKFYYQKLKELAAKSTQFFSHVDSDVKKVFSAVRRGVSGATASFDTFIKSVLRGGGALSLIEKGCLCFFSVVDASMKKLKAQITDAIESMGDLASQYSSFDNQQADKSNSNKNALSTLSNLQMSDSPLTNVQKEQQRQAIATLQKSYHDLNIEIDAASGKIKNFRDIQSHVLSGDQKKESDNVRRQIKALEKQNGIAAGAVQYKGGPVSEYWEKMKETYGWGAAQEAGGVQKQNVDKLMALRRREYQLTHSDRAKDADAMYQAKMKDQAERLADAQKYADAQRVYLQNAAEQAKSDEKIAGWQNQIKQIQYEQAEAKTKLAEQSKFELEYARAIAQGEYDKAAALKMEYDLRQQNLKLTEKERQALLDNQKAQKALNLQISNRDKAQDLKWQMMEKVGQGKEASEQRALRDAERTKGGKLTDSEIDATKKLNELVWNMSNMRDQQFGDLSIKTNSLTARGGFQGAAVVPDSDKYNREISMTNKTMLGVLQRIERLCDKFGKF